MKTASQVRSEFLEFFRARDHRIVPSAPVFPKDDPTLLFTNAGMNQFKDVFLGTGTRAYTRVADTQKCIRVSGKHNDLEEVGVDTYHHTFFEMLGNWSFGDYFKKEAIAWAWELLTDVWKLPKDRLWVTVFGGDARDGLPADEDAERIWREGTDIAPDRVLRFGRKDNFWEMGDTGPCGPCTEIHLDRGSKDDDPNDGKNPAIGVNAGNERFIELWNNVFIQYNRQDDGRLQELPACHVDTGMGFERVLSVLQGKKSNYDTDLFTPIFAALGEIAGTRYERTMSEKDIAFRVIADHVRALSAALADGALPGNEGRGYVLRRLLRRAARFGRQGLGMVDPFIHRLVPTVAEILGDVFPEIGERADHIAHVVENEERSFALTLDKGIALFEKLAAKVKKQGATIIPGDEAYDLYATYGFPKDLVELMARERNLAVNDQQWSATEEAHKEASRGSGGGKYVVSPQHLEGLRATEVRCYGETSGDARPLRCIEGRALVLDRTPFYAESGGQVGDAGVVSGENFRFRVDDTQKLGDFILHLGQLETGDDKALPATVQATVDVERRLDVMANHTGTHLLHWALRKVLGDHVNQQGSLVAPDRLRFDLTHARPISAEEIDQMERLINDKIVANTPLITTVEDLEEARGRGVTALFGEKYDDRVRVVDIGGYSQELCGGTHCAATGQIGAFVIIGERAVQAGVRRLEAVTRNAAIERMQEQRRTLREASQALKVSEQELVPRIHGLQDQVKDLRKKGEQQSQSDVLELARSLRAGAATVEGVSVVTSVLKGVSTAGLSPLCDAIVSLGGSVCGVCALEADGKAILVGFASKDLVKKRVHAGQIIKEIAPIVGGGGGGRPDFAQAGGKDPSKISAALEKARQLLQDALRSKVS